MSDCCRPPLKVFKAFSALSNFWSPFQNSRMSSLRFEYLYGR
nr:MAG TPA: hypothetical protein [Caudoviricetes sp.]